MSYHTKAREAFEAHRKAVEELRALDAAIGDAEPTAEQRSQLDRIHADIDAKDKEAERFLTEASIEDRSARLDALVGQQVDEGMRSEDDGLTPLEREARGLFLSPDHPEAKRSLEFGANSSEIARLQRRDLLAGTATDGAELVPTTLFGELYAQLREGADSMFSLGRSVITQSGEQMDFPTVSSFSTAALVAEAGAIGESDPQFATVSLDAYKYALAVQISSELEADNAVPGALPWVIDQAVDGIRRGVGAALITADGSSKPNGVDNGTTTSTIGGVDDPTADELISAQHDIVSGYRQNAVWIFNDATVKAIRQIKDTTNQYLWQPGMTAGDKATLLGAPVYTDDSVATAGANAKIGIYGDLKRGYLVRTVANIRAERSVDYAFLNDLVTWRFVGRFDGDIIDNNAFTVLTNEAA